MKKDGHTHTEFCPHGSEEDVELYIIEAIKQNFTEYSITEHAPISNDFLKKAAGVQYRHDQHRAGPGGSSSATTAISHLTPGATFFCDELCAGARLL
jgi:hypothetical protein